MELLLELLLTAVWEVFLQAGAELLVELGYESVAESLRTRSRAHPVLAGAGAVVLGALAGVITSLVWPSRIFEPGPVRAQASFSPRSSPARS